jgi:hypothetical protein
MMKHVLIVPVLLILAVPSYCQITSLYTDLAESKCRTLESSSDEGGSYLGICPGVAGYRLEVTEGDLRQTLSVISPNKKKHELRLSNVSGAFSNLGPRAEWRMNGKVPTALIFRFNANENPEDPSKIKSYLVVAKITKHEICVTDAVPPGPLQSTEARRFANNAATRPCKFSKLSSSIIHSKSCAVLK